MEKFEIDIKSDAGGDIEIITEIPAALKKFSLPVFQTLYAKCGIGDMVFNYFEGDGFSIWNSVYDIRHSAITRARGDFSVLELHIPFHNDLKSNWDKQKQYLLRNRQFELSYLPYVDNESKFIGGQTHHTFDIHYKKEYLLRFAKHFPLLDAFLAKVDKKKDPVTLLNTELFLSPAMIAIINSILNFDMRDVMAPFFFEGAILQFTTILIERLSGINPDAPKSYSAHEVECTYKAKETMMSKLSKNYSIRELSEIVGINDWKLQACFKHYFGETIFQYGQTARLESSKILLVNDKNYTIAEIAEMVGYPEGSNFSAAFKKKFGINPEDFRNDEKRRLSQIKNK